MAAKEMTWPSFWDGEEIWGPIETDYDVQQWPTVHLLDAKGVIRYFDVRDEELEEGVEAVLKESGN